MTIDSIKRRIILQLRNKTLHKLIIPAVTPLTASGDIDHKAVSSLVDFYSQNGADGLFLLGTTGEGELLDKDLRYEFVKTFRESSAEGLELIAVVSAPNLNQSIEDAKYFLSVGADAVSAYLPHYYLLTDEQILDYYLELSNRIDGNIYLYNIPKTVGMSIPIETVERLSRQQNIIGIKDSEYNEERQIQCCKIFKDREDFGYFCGAGAIFEGAIQSGCDGIIPSSANLIPGFFREMIDLSDMEQLKTIQEINLKFSSIYQKNYELGESISALKSIDGTSWSLPKIYGIAS